MIGRRLHPSEIEEKNQPTKDMADIIGNQTNPEYKERLKYKQNKEDRINNNKEDYGT